MSAWLEPDLQCGESPPQCSLWSPLLDDLFHQVCAVRPIRAHGHVPHEQSVACRRDLKPGTGARWSPALHSRRELNLLLQFPLQSHPSPPPPPHHFDLACSWPCSYPLLFFRIFPFSTFSAICCMIAVAASSCEFLWVATGRSTCCQIRKAALTFPGHRAEYSSEACNSVAPAF